MDIKLNGDSRQSGRPACAVHAGRRKTRPLTYRAVTVVLALALASSAAAEAGAVRAAVWGEVVNPGQYYLSGSPDILELISTGGGPTPDADLSNILLIRERDGTRTRLNLNQIATKGEPLFLTSGDVVIVHQSFWRKVQRALPVLTTLVTVANLAITVTLLATQE